ncbi:MAG: hypothetical protein EAZ91_09885 [Cytophagales bacterium]|nr:MAG: hypothetical protein EAZ91_09885 [Cytophagales bacterium]
MEVRFYVEGPSDRKFLQDIVKCWYNTVLPDDLVDVLDGKDNLENRFAEALDKNGPSFIANQIDEVKSVVILDADHNPAQRHQDVALLAQTHQFDFFLWPNNNLSGDLESILEQVYNPRHQPFFDCWQAYERCLTGEGAGKYYLPNRKGKIYAYMEALLAHSETQRKKVGHVRERDFLNEEHWNLTPTQSTLQPLKTFLDTYFSTPQ